MRFAALVSSAALLRERWCDDDEGRDEVRDGGLEDARDVGREECRDNGRGIGDEDRW